MAPTPSAVDLSLGSFVLVAFIFVVVVLVVPPAFATDAPRPRGGTPLVVLAFAGGGTAVALMSALVVGEPRGPVEDFLTALDITATITSLVVGFVVFGWVRRTAPAIIAGVLVFVLPWALTLGSLLRGG